MAQAGEQSASQGRKALLVAETHEPDPGADSRISAVSGSKSERNFLESAGHVPQLQIEVIRDGAPEAGRLAMNDVVQG